MFQSEITFGSLEHAAVHEAGHALMAKKVGASVEEMELYEEPRPHGRTRAARNQEQAPMIALGGIAAELLFFGAGRFVKEDGTKPSEKEFIDQAYRNASDDYESFWKNFVMPPDIAEALKEQSAQDRAFFDYAQIVAKQVDQVQLESLAFELVKQRKLSKQDITVICKE